MSAPTVLKAFEEHDLDQLAAWGEPDFRIISGHRTPAPPLPLSVFDGWRGFLEGEAAARSLPVDYVCAGLMTAACTLIGNSRRIVPKPGWAQPFTLWWVIVGDPSSGKSPGIEPSLDIMRKIEADLALEHTTTLRHYDGALAEQQAIEEQWKREINEAVKAKRPPPEKPVSAMAPEKPPRPRLLLQDATTQKIAHILSGNPRGVLHFRDELSGWFASFDRYSGGEGADRAFWIECFDGRSYVVDRVSSDTPIVIPWLSSSILGGTQPELLPKTLLSGEDDGLAARFLWTWPDPVPRKWTEATFDKSDAERAFRRLYAIPLGQDQDGRQHWDAMPFSAEGKAKFIPWYEAQDAEGKSLSGKFASFHGKLPGLAVRLSGVLELLWWSIGHADHPPREVSARAIVGALLLVDDYFKPMAARCFGDASLSPEERNASLLARIIAGKKKTAPNVINARFIMREAGTPAALRDKNAMMAAVEHLIELDWLRHRKHRPGVTTGRAATDYLVNPLLWELL